MQSIQWTGRISCLQGDVSQLAEAEQREIIRDISCGEMRGITTTGVLWEVLMKFEPECSLCDLDKVSRKLLTRAMLSGKISGTITTNLISSEEKYAQSDAPQKNDIPAKSSMIAETIPVRVSKDTFNNIMATLTSLFEDVKYAARAKQMSIDIADNVKISETTSICVCVLTLEQIQELITLLSCSTVCPEMDFFQLIADKQEYIR